MCAWIAKLLSGMIQFGDLNLLSPPLQALEWRRTKGEIEGECVHVRESEERLHVKMTYFLSARSQMDCCFLMCGRVGEIFLCGV